MNRMLKWREMAKEEMDNSQERLPVLEEEIKLMLVPADPQDSKNAILEIRGGAGATKQLSLPATSSVCMPNSVKPKVGKWKSPMRTKGQPVDSKKLFVV